MARRRVDLPALKKRNCQVELQAGRGFAALLAPLLNSSAAAKSRTLLLCSANSPAALAARRDPNFTGEFAPGTPALLLTIRIGVATFQMPQMKEHEYTHTPPWLTALVAGRSHGAAGGFSWPNRSRAARACSVYPRYSHCELASQHDISKAMTGPACRLPLSRGKPPTVDVV